MKADEEKNGWELKKTREQENRGEVSSPSHCQTLSSIDGLSRARIESRFDGRYE